ncbi:hypothetical protein [Nocardia sp. NPDC052566]|uniref:hypothetical protein n=1 Tax=Nocardia sp. NPDC052566 TaxID=3364330 RepID=UPI0037C5A5A7
MVHDLPDTYRELLAEVVIALERFDHRSRLDRLFALISPLLDDVAAQDEEHDEEPEMRTADAVAGFRGIATGEDLPIDTIHYTLTCFALTESEDQDPRMLVRSQSAWLAAAWLQLHAGRHLRLVEEVDDYGLATLPDIVNMLTWTRSQQVDVHTEYLGDAHSDGYADLPAALAELRVIHTGLAAPRP